MSLVGFFHLWNMLKIKLFGKTAKDRVKEAFKVKPTVDEGVASIHVQLAETVHNAHTEFCYLMDSFIAMNEKTRGLFMTKLEQDELYELGESYMAELVKVGDKLTAKNKELRTRFEESQKPKD